MLRRGRTDEKDVWTEGIRYSCRLSGGFWSGSRKEWAGGEHTLYYSTAKSLSWRCRYGRAGSWDSNGCCETYFGWLIRRWSCQGCFGADLFGIDWLGIVTFVVLWRFAKTLGFRARDRDFLKVRLLAFTRLTHLSRQNYAATTRLGLLEAHSRTAKATRGRSSLDRISSPSPSSSPSFHTASDSTRSPTRCPESSLYWLWQVS